MKKFSFFHWQNLLENKCPGCGHKLLSRKIGANVYHNCDNPDGCDFGISDDHLLEILSRPDHPLRLYLTPEQQTRLEIYLKSRS